MLMQLRGFQILLEMVFHGMGEDCDILLQVETDLSSLSAQLR